MSTSSAGWVRSLHAFAISLKLDASRLFDDAGLDVARLSDPLARFPQSRLNMLWDRLVEQTGNPGIGLMFGRQVTPGSFGAVGYVMMASAVLGDAITHALRHQRYLAEAMRGGLKPVDGGFFLELENLGDLNGVRVQATEAMLSACLHFARWIMQEPVAPDRVLLRHAPTVPQKDYRTFFGCAVETGAAASGLMLPSELVNRPLPSHDPAMLEHHLRLAESLHRDNRQPLSRQVSQLVRELLPSGDFDQQLLATVLHLTPKTLQRRLDDEGTGFKSILDSVRFDLARQYLRQPGLPLQEVAGLCGYSDYSAFAKAFRHWSGMTPKTWRVQSG